VRDLYDVTQTFSLRYDERQARANRTARQSGRIQIFRKRTGLP